MNAAANRERPKPRTSSLRAATPFTPPPPPEVPAIADVPPVAAARPAPAAGSAATPAPSTPALPEAPAGATTKWPKMSFYASPEVQARIRAAVRGSMPHEQHRNLSDFLLTAVMREVERVEYAHNHGQQWQGIGPGEGVPHGRPQVKP